jgi:hypothetical protein
LQLKLTLLLETLLLLRLTRVLPRRTLLLSLSLLPTLAPALLSVGHSARSKQGYHADDRCHCYSLQEINFHYPLLRFQLLLQPNLSRESWSRAPSCLTERAALIASTY